MATKTRNTVWIEVVPQGARPAGVRAGIAASPQLAKLGLDQLEQQLGSVSRTMVNAMKLAQPDSCTVEFSLGVKGGSKIPIILSGEASAAFKVSLTWKKESSSGKAG